MSAETNTPIIDNQETNPTLKTKTAQPQSPVNAPRNLEMTADGGTVVGLGEGKLTCNIHEGFETFSKAEFDKHCEETGHILNGSLPCANCKQEVLFEGIPYKVDQKIFCPDCLEGLVQSQQELHQGNNNVRLRSVVAEGNNNTQNQSQRGANQ
jgi:hypothetical protein